MAAVLSGLNVFAKTFRASACLQRYFRPSSFEIPRCFATEDVKKKLEEKPKKPGSPFFIYLSSVRPQLVKENPDKKVIELTAVAAANYKLLSDEEKKALRLQYEEKLADYKKDMKDFLAGCTAEEITEMKQEASDKKEKRKKKQLKKEEKKMHKPKKPLPGFLRFVQDCRTDDRNNHPEKLKRSNITEYAKEIAAVWKNMSVTEKQPYLDAAKKDHKVYEKKLSAWEDQMIEENKLRLVRLTHQPKDKRKQKKRKGRRARKVVAKKSTATRKTKRGRPAKKKSVAPEKEHDLSDTE